MKKLLFLLFGAAAAQAAIIVVNGGGETYTYDFDSFGLERLQIDNTSGHVKILPSDARIAVTTIKRKWNERCKLYVDKVVPVVMAKVERPIGEDCQVDFEIKVPKKVDIEVSSGSGNVEVSGIEGTLTFNVGSGNVKAEGVFKKIDGKSGSGSVEVAGLAGGGNLSVGTGEVSLKFKEDPKGQVDIKSGTGNATLQFPKGSKIKADLISGSGDLKNELGSSSSADFSVNMKTGSGDIEVKTY